MSYKNRKVLSTNAHLMLASLDKKDITRSDALLLLPVVGVGIARIYTTSDLIELGEFVNGCWIAYETISCENNSGVIDVTINDDNVSKMFMIMHKQKRDEAIKLLESAMLN